MKKNNAQFLVETQTCALYLSIKLFKSDTLTNGQAWSWNNFIWRSEC